MQLRKRKRGIEEEMGVPEKKKEGAWKRKWMQLRIKERGFWKSKWMHLRKRKRGLGRGNECT